MGDLNINLQCNNTSIMFKELLHSLNLHQHITEQTHNKGGLLDVMIIREEELAISDVEITPVPFSDHPLLTCPVTLPGIPNPRKRKSVSTGNTHNSSEVFFSYRDILGILKYLLAHFRTR